MNTPNTSTSGNPTNNAGSPTPKWAAPAGVTLSRLCTVLLDENRWQILRELSRGEALPVLELVRRTRKSRNIVQKNMGILKDSNLVVQTYGHLYRLSPELAPTENGTRLDLGYCILCLDRLPG